MLSRRQPQRHPQSISITYVWSLHVLQFQFKRIRLDTSLRRTQYHMSFCWLFSVSFILLKLELSAQYCIAVCHVADGLFRYGQPLLRPWGASVWTGAWYSQPSAKEAAAIRNTFCNFKTSSTILGGCDQAGRTSGSKARFWHMPRWQAITCAGYSGIVALWCLGPSGGGRSRSWL